MCTLRVFRCLSCASNLLRCVFLVTEIDPFPVVTFYWWYHTHANFHLPTKFGANIFYLIQEKIAFREIEHGDCRPHWMWIWLFCMLMVIRLHRYKTLQNLHFGWTVAWIFKLFESSLRWKKNKFVGMPNSVIYSLTFW